MTIVSYAGKRIIPVSRVSMNKSFIKNSDGKNIGSEFNITMFGTLLPDRGSPSSDMTFWTGGEGTYPPDETMAENAYLGSLIRKQEALRNLLSTPGESLEWQSGSGAAPCKSNPDVIEITFDEGVWVNRCDFQVSFVAKVVYVNGLTLGEDSFSEYITSSTEEWSMETGSEQPENENSPRTYVLTHTVSATGARFYDETGTLEKDGWEQAKDWVSPRLGINSSIVSSEGVNNLPSYYQGFNHARSENTDKTGGTYSVTETWLLASGTALEDFTIQISTSRDNYLTTVGIQGEIRGLETRDSNMNLVGSKHHYADTKWGQVQGVLLTRAQLYSGLTLNVVPLSTSKGVNPVAGTISYNYEYDNRPSNLISNCKMENVTVSHNLGADAFATIFVLGRTAGGLLQNLYTREVKSVNISIDLVMNIPGITTGDGSLTSLKNYYTYVKPSNLEPYKTQIENIISANNPINYGASTVFISEHNESWNPATQAYSRQISYTYE